MPAPIKADPADEEEQIEDGNGQINSFAPPPAAVLMLENAQLK